MNITKTLILATALIASIPYASAAGDSCATPASCPDCAPKASSKLKSDYPLKTCVVSGEELGGDMGDPVDYVYHQEGKPDRLVKLCCSKCVARFKKDPAKYLKKLDEAEAAAKSP